MAGKGKVTGGIVKYLLQNIREGAWKPGDKIPSENELCTQLGVSRVSVRSALHQLIVLGILESRHGKGTYLISNDLSAFGDLRNSAESGPEDGQTAELLQLLEFRAFLEPSVCARAAETASAELIGRLSALLEQMQIAVGSSREFVEADIRFHMELCAAVGNPILIRTMENVLQKKSDVQIRLNRAVGSYGGIYYHALILEALKRHDAKRAASLMMEHLQRSMDDLKQ